MTKRSISPQIIPSTFKPCSKAQKSKRERDHSSEPQTCFLELLPPELLLTIFSHLSTKEIIRLGSLSQTLSRAVTLHFRSFKTLTLSPFHNDSHLSSIIERCPFLHTLDAEGSSLSLEGFLTLSKALKNLRSVVFPFNVTSQRLVYQDPKASALIRQLFLHKPLMDSPASSFAGPEVLAQCQNLRSAWLKGLSLVAPLSTPQGLEVLDLDSIDFQLQEAGVTPFDGVHLPSLRELSVSWCSHFDPAWLNSLMACSHLSTLELYRMELPSSFLATAHFPSLTQLRLVSISVPDAVAFGRFLSRHAETLQELTLTTLTALMIESLGTFSSPAKILRVESYDSDLVSDAHLAAFLSGFPQLQSLELSGLCGLTRLPPDATFYGTLRFLKLSQLDEFDSSSLEPLLARCPRLVELDADFSDNLQAPNLAIQSPSLTRLSLSVCCARTITLLACPKLQVVTVRSSLGDDELSLESFDLQGLCPRLSRISLPDETSSSFEFTSTFITSIHQCAPALRSIQMPFNEHISSLVHSLRLPHVVSHNSRWIANSILKILSTLLEKEQQLSSLLKEKRSQVKEGGAFEGLVSIDEVLSSGKGDHREWFYSNIQSLIEQFTSEQNRNVDILRLLSEHPSLAQEVEMLLHFKRVLVIVTSSPQDGMVTPLAF